MPEQAKHRLLRLLRFKIKSQEHADNTATVWLRADDLAALIREHGNPVHIAEL